MSAELTDEEWAEIRHAVYNPGFHVRGDSEHHRVVLSAAVESIVAAHVRRALEDAADELKDAKEPDGSTAMTPVKWIEDWLRARAAAADPRETKD